MRVTLINKSDSTGGAAVVSRRLMEALRQQGVDARMLVTEKLSDSPFVELAGSSRDIKKAFLKERLQIFLANGFNRQSLFKIDTGREGMPLWKHPWVKDADAILLNWVNQGMLSLKGVKKFLETGKPVIWTMHDMWCMTGICHHAGSCNHFQLRCGNCPLLGRTASEKDISFKTHGIKHHIYNLHNKISFVAVSNWLKGKAMESSLLQHQHVEVIPNAFNPPSFQQSQAHDAPRQRIRLLFGAARIDDPIKGIDNLREASKILVNQNPSYASLLEIAFFGNVRDPNALEGFAIPVVSLGVLHGEDAVANAYRHAEILVSASSYETLPGTLVEAQAYGCIPVSYNRGGQSDIIDHGVTGYLQQYSESPDTRAANLAIGIEKAIAVVQNIEAHRAMIKKMRDSVEEKFSYSKVAKQYISLIESRLGNSSPLNSVKSL